MRRFGAKIAKIYYCPHTPPTSAPAASLLLINRYVALADSDSAAAAALTSYLLLEKPLMKLCHRAAKPIAETA
jgi:hypothetical protein